MIIYSLSLGLFNIYDRQYMTKVYIYKLLKKYGISISKISFIEIIIS